MYSNRINSYIFSAVIFLENHRLVYITNKLQADITFFQARDTSADYLLYVCMCTIIIPHGKSTLPLLCALLAHRVTTSVDSSTQNVRRSSVDSSILNDRRSIFHYSFDKLKQGHYMICDVYNQYQRQLDEGSSLRQQMLISLKYHTGLQVDNL